MVNFNANALGILFPNSYDSTVPELVGERLMASIPFASRYRLVDFILSSMVNCGIDNVSVIVRKNYHSLMDHLGSGREWDLSRKNGGLNMVPPYAEKTVKVYTGRVEALASILDFLREQKEKYVVMADTNLAVNFDFKAMLEAHMASGADVTIAYTRQPLPESLTDGPHMGKEMFYTLDLDEDRVTGININSKAGGIQNLSMNIYITERESLIEEISEAFVRGYSYFERDILAPNLKTLNVRAFRYDGYVARINDMKSYFEENMKMLQDENVDALFNEASPIYTKIRDDTPTRYINGATAKNVMVADGCVIEGEITNSILFRGVRVGKGAKVKNCVLMQGTVIEPDACVEYVVTDKNVTITAGKELKGNDSFPVYVAKHQKV